MTVDLKRRDFLRVVGVSGAGAAAVGCSEGEIERLIPYVVPPEEVTPGVATWYATTCGECSAACGTRVRTREGRAVMIEGNPEHPLSKGGVCSRGISSLQALYNPDRIAQPLRKGPDGGFAEVSWEDALAELAERLGAAAAPILLTGSEGPTGARVFQELAEAAGGRRVIHDALADEALRAATEIAYGVRALPRYRIQEARTLVSFGADFMGTWISPVQFSGDFAAMHAVRDLDKGHFVFVGPHLPLSGQSADEWLPCPPGAETEVALALAGELVRRGVGDAGPYRSLVVERSLEGAADAAGLDAHSLELLADQLASAPSLALGPGHSGARGDRVAANVAAHVLNSVTGALGRTVDIPGAPDSEASPYSEMEQAIGDMNDGACDALLVSGANPAYSLPSGAGFAAAMERVSFVAAFADALDETTMRADLVLPALTPLESWGDAKVDAGVYSIRQPAMRPVPLFDARAPEDIALEIAARLSGSGSPPSTFLERLKAEHTRHMAEAGEDPADIDAFWRRAVRRALLERPESEPEPEAIAQLAQTPQASVDFDRGTEDPGDGTELIVYPSARFGDGRFANRPWLQELPDPVSRVTWQSWLEVHPDTAAELGIGRGGLPAYSAVRTVQIASVETEHGSVELPVWVYPGIRPGVVAIATGGGHEGYGRFADGNGVNPMTLLPAGGADGELPLATRATVRPTGRRTRLATTEGTSDQEDRGVAPAVALSQLGLRAGLETVTDDGHGAIKELQGAGGFVPTETDGRADEYPPPGARYGDYAEEHPRWAMAIDLDRCNGCGACVTACQAENNIPWVYEDEVLKGREMHWLRIERYYETVDATHSGPLDIRFLPMLCQHCNNAPCEPVCPVFAAYHTPDGLNAQAYNRCVGTRYCANNCPYKVRVFNWLRYTEKDKIPEPLNWQFNPDVTVRDNGVMEKCSFCVQRIRDAGNRAALQDREVEDGEVETACQSVCPSNVISFGNIRDERANVTRAIDDERVYRVLDKLINTQPAVHYLKKVTRHEVEAGGH